MLEKTPEKKVGAVLVVGGGIGGMQASLDLANAGFKVYLVEETSAIGGRMAQLDKTFPTNDCSMCIISPKLVEVGRHLNIEIITNAEIEKVEGEAGHFKVEVLKRPRYVDLSKCTACGECLINCPVELLNEFDENLSSRKAIFKRYPQATPNAFAIEKRGISPCKGHCPAGIHVQGYVALIGQKKFKEALALIRKNNPLPAICGRVCTYPCEDACTRKKVDDPVAIMSLKRFVSDWEYLQEKPEEPPVKNKRDEKVAIIGAGPAGLSAAFYLAKEGFQVTIFEAHPEPGGMMAWGIPDYRLPREILNLDIDFIRRLGVEIKTDTPIGPELALRDLFKAGFRSIFLGVGAQQSMRLGIEGEGLKGVVHGVDYLREINAGREIPLGEKVAVIGGGNVAIDVVRTALRKGSKNTFIIYRRSREEMPALEEEIAEAEEEGVTINYLVAPKRILGKGGKVAGIECIRMELGEPDESGRRRPVPIAGSEFEIEVDSVVPAIGQSPELSFLPDGKEWKITRRGTLEVDPLTYATQVEGVFAGGDMVSGPKTVVSAIGAGREAAISISRYLQGADLRYGREKEFKVVELEPEGVKQEPRYHPPKVAVSERTKDFLEVQQGLTEEVAVAEAKRCLNCGVCSECLQCVEVCLPGAIDHEMREERETLKVGSIILAPGFEKFNPHLKGEFGYGRYPNVITSLEFERILSASGPFQGEVKRPSDGTHPRRIAWIQCVGSRDASCYREYCSAVCCMYATKEAIIAKEHDAAIEPTIFFMDIRAYGKGFDAYYERADKEYGIRYIHCMVSRVVERPLNKNLELTYIDDQGEVTTEEFDLVILSVGMVPSENTKALGERLGITLDQYGFCQTDEFSPVAASRPGVFVCGVFQGPKDIPETVAQASGAAASASGLLSFERGALVKKREFPAEIEVEEETPRIGVFVCRCGINIAGVVDVSAVKTYAATLPQVVYVDENLFTCSQDTQGRIIEAIKEHGLNRVVVASCSPRTHEPMFQDTIREAGLNKYLFEMANIRDQCSWVHMQEKEKATEKAKDLVRMAVATASQSETLKELSQEVKKKGLVIGGGLTGMIAALELARQGFETFLVEKEETLGGNLQHIYSTLNGGAVQSYLKELIDRVKENPLIQVFTNALIVSCSGFVGNFKTELMIGPGMYTRILEHGITIVATGGEELKPEEYLYGEDERVLTQQEFEQRLAKGDLLPIDSLVMIQCVGSRNEDRPYCSRICCSVAIKNALALKEKNPQAVIYILYRDIRTYGLLERYYEKARKKGIVFIRYDLDTKPKVEVKGGRLSVSVRDPILKRELVLTPDLLVLSSAVTARENEELATMLKVPLTQEGFFLEAHMKLRPVDFATEGIYLCGLAHSPKLIGESISQALAAVARACTILSQDQIQIGGVVSVVNEELCAACLTCVRVCPYDVPVINERGVAEIEPAKCQGCGICASDCPAAAIELQHFKDAQIIVKCDNLWREAG